MYQVLLHSTFSVGHSIFENGTKYQVLCTKYLQKKVQSTKYYVPSIFKMDLLIHLIK